jgi:hypothetical protein
MVGHTIQRKDKWEGGLRRKMGKENEKGSGSKVRSKSGRYLRVTIVREMGREVKRHRARRALLYLKF